MQQLEELDEAGVGIDDARLIYGWITFNTLYGRWDAEKREPVSDVYSFKQFLGRIVEEDVDGRIEPLHTDHRDLYMAPASGERLKRFGRVRSGIERALDCLLQSLHEGLG